MTSSSAAYTGSFANLERLLGAWRRAERGQGNDVPPVASKLELVRDPDIGHAILPVVAAALCINPRGLLTDMQARKVARASRTVRKMSARKSNISPVQAICSTVMIAVSHGSGTGDRQGGTARDGCLH
jgi:hypothetical protein